ncbi:unnamed protein product, partial [Polarella glacialis]
VSHCRFYPHGEGCRDAPLASSHLRMSVELRPTKPASLGQSQRFALWLAALASSDAVLSTSTLPSDLGSSSSSSAPFARDDGRRCVHWHRPGKLLFYKDTAVFPIGISVPADLVESSPPRKAAVLAPFVGSSRGGEVKEYRFGPFEEDKYHDFYRRHRFAETKCKGGWDALRHPEILALGTVPIFRGLAKSPPFVVPFVPKRAILEAEQKLLPYSSSMEAAYNATVNNLLSHTRQCLSAESMAARVLRSMGLWPSQRPLRILFATCGWGFTFNPDGRPGGDGWQGPVSIGLFLGLHSLLQRLPGSRIIDAPSMEPDDSYWPFENTSRSYLWYTARRQNTCPYAEEDLRYRMYGFGFSYARRLPQEALATDAERERVPASLMRREFDGIIFGKVGPRQGCDPLPLFDKAVVEAGYPPQRVALIYGGDFGLGTGAIAKDARLRGSYGSVFFREMDANTQHFSWKPASVLPQACYMEKHWRSFFNLWSKRLRCWGCQGVDVPHSAFVVVIVVFAVVIIVLVVVVFVVVFVIVIVVCCSRSCSCSCCCYYRYCSCC